jgi:hypothetical protein
VRYVLDVRARPSVDDDDEVVDEDAIDALD